jgi:hypothetical protein
MDSIVAIKDVQIKAAGDWELDVLGVPFGDPSHKDSDGQYFDPDTNLHIRTDEETAVYYYHGMTPEGKPQADPVQIGTAKFARTDAQGHWFRVVLDQANDYARRVWEAAKRGAARASSGSIAHLVRVARDGKILSWPFAELSVFDSEGRRQPAHPAAVALPVAKAQFHPISVIQPEATGEAEQPGAADKPTKHSKGVIAMDEKDVELKIEAALKADRAARDAEAQAKAAEQTRIDAAVKAEKEKWEAEAAKARRLPQHDPHLPQFADTYKYDGYSPEDLSTTAAILASNRQPVSPALMKALAIKCSELSGERGMYVKSAMKASLGMASKEEIEAAIKAATDPAYSTLSNYGAEWVGTAYSSAIWEAIRAGNRVVAKIPSVVIPDGYSSEYFPLEGADPTWYLVTQTTAADGTMKVPAATVPASQMGTGTKQITVGKMGARAMYTGEMVEDSLINYAAQLRMQLQASGAEIMEHIVIDGDTASENVTNINDIAGQPAGTEVFLLTNGFRKSALVTTTANSRSAGGSLSEDDFLETMWLMGTAGLAGADLAKCSFVIDPNVYKAALKMAVLKTKDVWSNATLEKGVLTGLWGYEVIPSWQMHRNSTVRKANAAGKVDIDTVANNTTGSILSVRWDQWKIAYKRRMTMETTRFANSDSWEIVALARWGLGQRDTEASAVSFNVGV